MGEPWQTYRGAPASGTTVCARSDIPQEGTLAVELDGFPLLLVRVGGHLRAYVNACPHQFLPLDHRGDRLLSADGTVIRCTNHAAGFSVETGAGVEGLGVGTCLDSVPVSVSDDVVVVGSPP